MDWGVGVVDDDTCFQVPFPESSKSGVLRCELARDSQSVHLDDVTT